MTEVVAQEIGPMACAAKLIAWRIVTFAAVIYRNDLRYHLPVRVDQEDAISDTTLRP